MQSGTIALVIGGTTVVAGVGGTAADGGWTTHKVEYMFRYWSCRRSEP